MSIKTAIFIIVSSFIFAFGVIYFGFSVSYNNSERELRTQINEQISIVDEEICNIWYIISSELCIEDIYEDEFRRICPQLLYGTTKEDEDVVVNWFSNHSRRFNKKNYNKIISSVDVYRIEFIKTQSLLMKNIEKHDELCTTYPSALFICNKTMIFYEPITLEDK